MRIWERRRSAARGLPGCGIDHRDSVAAVVDEELLACPVGLAHGASEAVAQALVVLAELAVLVCPVALGSVVLLPDKLQRHSFALELLVHVGIVRVRALLSLQNLRKQQPLEGCVVQILRQRPTQGRLDRSLHVVAHRAFGDAGCGRDPLHHRVE